MKILFAFLLLPCLGLFAQEDALSLAKGRMAAGDYDQAVKLLKAGIKNNSNAARYDYHLYLGNAYFFSGDLESAAQAYQRCLSMNPSAREARSNLASVYSAQGRHKEAITLYEALLKQSGDHPDVHYNLSLSYRYTGDLAQAETHCQAALDARPEEAGYITGLGEIAELKNSPDEARRLYLRAIRISPKNGRPRVNLAKLCLTQGRLAEAEKESRAAVDADPKLASARSLLGDIYLAKGEPEPAAYEYKASLMRNPRQPQVHANLGQVYEQLKLFDEAQENYARAVQLQPGAVEFRLKWAALLFRLKKYAESRDALKEALSLKEESAPLHNLLGAVYTRLRNFEKADHHLSQALRHQKDFAEAKLNLGILRFHQGQYSKAQPLLEDALKASSGFYDLHFFLGKIYLQKGLSREALARFGELLRIDHSRPEGYGLCAKAHEKLNELDRAEEVLLKGIEALPKEPDVYFTAAEFYFRNQLTAKYSRAMEHYEKTLELDPKFPEREMVLKRLQILNEKVNRIEKKKTDREKNDEERLERERERITVE